MIFEIKKLAIVGSGQIGTSVAMSAALAHPDMEIIAYDNAAIEKPFLEALHLASVNKGNVHYTIDPADIKGANLVILATPVGHFASAVKEISPYVNTETIFTDVGSVKELSQQRIRGALDEYIGQETSYVPFHILNGNAGEGPSTASATIFKAPGALVPDQAPNSAENMVEKFWSSIGTTVHRMSADKHDMIFGTASHLEHAIMFSFMKKKTMDGLLSSRGEMDAGNWVQAMTRIADAGPNMWVGNFYDNRDQVLKTAKHFRKFLTEFADVAEKDDDFLSQKVEELHLYAQDKISTRIAPFKQDSLAGQETRHSAFAGLISMAITANVERVEKETGQNIAVIANPSLKDGLGPIAIDPVNVVHLIREHRRDIKPMVEDFLEQFDRTLGLIENRDSKAVQKLVEEVTKLRKHLPNVFSAPVAGGNAEAQPMPQPK